MGLGFTSPWTSGVRAVRRPFPKSCCSMRPAMTLLSHEKVDVILSTDDGEVAKYKLELEIPASVSKAKRKESIQAVKKNADFKGFRKGTIPPFILNEIDNFVLHNSCNVVIEDAARELELSPIEGKQALSEEDLKELKKRFRCGEDFFFTCEVQLQSINAETPSEELEDIVSYEGELPTIDIANVRENQ